MNIKTLFIGLIVLLIAGGALAYTNGALPFLGGDNVGNVCPQDAKLCPDGSSVGRTGVNCEFAECPAPAPSAGTFITGKITLSPTCPVETTPPDPACAPKPFKTTIEVRRSGLTAIVATTQSNDSGEFKVAVSPGTYDVSAVGGNPLPACSTKNVTVAANTTMFVDLSCDTGIR